LNFLSIDVRPWLALEHPLQCYQQRRVQFTHISNLEIAGKAEYRDGHRAEYFLVDIAHH